VETAEIINDVINQQKFGAAEKSITLSNLLERNTTMYADKDMAVSVLKTILQNTIRVMDKNGSITFSGDRQPLLIRVEGNIPIKESYIKLLHTENYDNNCSEIEKSVKFGWMFCRSVVERHSSRIVIDEIAANILEIHVFAPITS
jgi:signal transduction histidine kinase